MITILTPTYNREKLLNRLAHSLIEQTRHTFEWLIIDDGSIDNTKDFIDEIKDHCPFPVRYIYKENGGKHSALNLGFHESYGDWIFPVDSDDWLQRDCVDTVINFTENINENVGSISILKKYENGQVIGDKFPDNLRNYLDRIELGVSGDKADIFRRQAINEFRFPEFPGESFMAESPMFIWFGQRYETRFINYSGYVCEYQGSGLSSNSIENRHRCYKSALYVYSRQYSALKGKKMKFKAAVNWWRFRLGKKDIRTKNTVPSLYSFIGLILFIKDCFQFRRLMFFR